MRWVLVRPVSLDACVAPLAQDDWPRRVAWGATGPIVVAGKVALATASLANLPTGPNPRMAISDVPLPTLAGVGRVHGETVTLARRVVADSRDGRRSARDARLACRQRRIADQLCSIPRSLHRPVRPW